MSRDLVVFKDDEVHGILVVRKGQPQVVEQDDLREVLGNLSPSDVFDFVRLNDASILVISDQSLSEEQMREIFGEEARFLKSEDLPAKASSWQLPMAIPSMLERAIKTGRDELDDALRHAGAYLESHTRHKEMSPWQEGLIAASIRAVWKEAEERELTQGESHWGWLRKYTLGNGDPDKWESEKGILEARMRAADIMIRNIEKRDWISKLSLAQILSIPISKVTICCGAISDSLFDFSYKLQTYLLDQTVTNARMRHLIGEARRHEDKIPVQDVDKETGEISYVRPYDGEIVDDPDEPVLDEYLPDMQLGVETSKPKHGKPYWTYNWERKTFGHWEFGTWTPAIAVISDDSPTRKFVERILAWPEVHADYDTREGE